ncbi:MAG: 30S ribosomal protein S16 [Candidatus Dormibacteria bacterium]
MAVKIRLRRMGAKKRPFYRLVVADARSPRDGRFIESVGTYDPIANPAVVRIDAERVKDWISKGARPTDVARQLLVAEGVIERSGPSYSAADRATKLSKKAQAKVAATAEAAATAKAEAAAAKAAPVAEPVAEPAAEPAAEPSAEVAAPEVADAEPVAAETVVPAEATKVEAEVEAEAEVPEAPEAADAGHEAPAAPVEEG